MSIQSARAGDERAFGASAVAGPRWRSSPACPPRAAMSSRCGSTPTLTIRCRTRNFDPQLAAPSALTGGYQRALWGLGAIALLALPAILALVGRDRPEAGGETGLPAASPALAGTR